jgi:hypothetical protein
MVSTEQTLEDLTLTISQEIHVQAPLDITFASLLEQLGPGNETPEGKSLNMKIEPWPGGRWYRDLGDDAAGVCRSVIRVVSVRLQRAISAERSGWGNADRLPA